MDAPGALRMALDARGANEAGFRAPSRPSPMTYRPPQVMRRAFTHRLRPWLVLLSLPLALALLASWDLRLKSGPDTAILPAGCVWTIAAPDFPLFWARLAQSRPGLAFQDAFPMRVHAAELDVRLATGVRPTPGRWRAWMGSKFAAGYFEGAAGICVRPGLLLRTAGWFARVLGRSTEENGIFCYGEYCYAWRDGLLIVSESAGFIRAALESAPVTAPRLEPAELEIAWPGEQGGKLRIRAEDGLPVSGSVPGTLTARTEGLTLTSTLPGTSLFSVATTKPSEAFQLFGAVWAAARPYCHSAAPGFTVLAERLSSHLERAWQWDRLGRAWDFPIAEFAFALTGISRESTLPVPVVAAVFRPVRSGPGAHPLMPLLGGEAPLLYEWNGAPGWARSMLGREWTLCLASMPKVWIAASQEREMRRITGDLIDGPAREADLVLRADWARAAPEVAALLSEAADYELLPEMNARDAAPWIDACKQFLGAAGVTTLDAWARGGRLEFRGWLCGDGEAQQ